MSVDIHELHARQKAKEVLPTAQLIADAIKDKAKKVTIYAIPTTMILLRKHFGDDFVEPAHVPTGYTRGMVYVVIQHSRVAKTLFTANVDASLLW